MNNEIIINNRNEYIENNQIKNFLNEQDNECIICYCLLCNDSLILINNFCGCYKNCFFCKKCFINWYLKDCKCFVCHKKYINEEGNIFKFNVPLLKEELFRKINELDIEYIRNLVNRDENQMRNMIPNRRQDSINRDIIINISSNQVSPITNNNHRQIGFIDNYQDLCGRITCILIIALFSYCITVLSIKYL